MPELAPWELRVHKTVVIGQWIALVVAVVADLGGIGRGGTLPSMFALTAASIYVIGSSSLPERYFRIRFGVEAISLAGALLVAVALLLSGGASSPYLLLSVGPAVFATLYGGLRAGLTTGLLSAGLLLLTNNPGDVATFAEAGPAMALYVIFVLMVGVLRRLLHDIYEQAAGFATESEQARRQLETLKETHGVLVRLSEDVSAGRLNAVEVGASTLDALIRRFPKAAGRLIIDRSEGPVVLAARGVPDPEGYPRTFPLVTADIDVGHLELTTKEIMTTADEEAVRTQIQPVAIAFANLHLLHDIVGAAVAEERMRLAREMHDEIGPSLASLGLSLDMTSMQQSDRPELASDLMILRSNVTKLVEDVRATVADLRSTPGPTLTARILQASASLEGEPAIVVDLDERRPPRPALIGDLTSIVTEAIRNAHRHSKGTTVIVSGRIDRAFGDCRVSDDGTGFDATHEPDGHFGLIGMRERAERIGASIYFKSRTGAGTTVTVKWGSKP